MTDFVKRIPKSVVHFSVQFLVILEESLHWLVHWGSKSDQVVIENLWVMFNVRGSHVPLQEMVGIFVVLVSHLDI